MRNALNQRFSGRTVGWFLIGIIIFIVAVIVFSVGSRQAGYAAGSRDRARIDRKVRLNHPKIKYVYREHVVKKHIPVVHIEDATGKQVARAMKHAHENDLASVRAIDAAYTGNDKGDKKEINKLRNNLKKNKNKKVNNKKKNKNKNKGKNKK